MKWTICYHWNDILIRDFRSSLEKYLYKNDTLDEKVRSAVEMEKNYDVLVKDNIFFGGVADAKDAVKQEGVDLVVDVRVNGLTKEEQVEAGFEYLHRPIADEDDVQVVAESIKAGVMDVVAAFEDGKKVYFHCGGGGGRAGVMATATLIELGLADSVEEAEEKVKQARPKVNIRPKMKLALEELYKDSINK